MKVIVTKTLETESGKRFRVGEDIGFVSKGKHYIADIKDITEDEIIITNIEFEKKNVKGDMIIKLSDIDEDSISYVYYD